ncbi:polypeptide N-acetylgalactosaminyltransferase 5-like protein, partial [Leptotrombidium deliense]
GGFDWRLRFRWLRLPQRVIDDRFEDRSKPIKYRCKYCVIFVRVALFRSATPSGGIFAIDKQFFNYFEKFDDGLSFYGSESIELGLASWTCGGSIEIIPCSRVAHVFRDSIPYSFPGVQRTISLFNSARILETWMDDYRMFYYILFPDAVRKDRGNTTHRRELRENLKCHPFTWYLENVFTESTFPLHYK